MLSVIAFLVLVGILVLVHEFGHFLMAKLFRVRVEVFSIGFGPPIFSKRIGETVYQIASIPLGGYVKLYGEEESINDPEAFSSKKPWQKILIAFGGPLFNFILTILLFTVVFTVGVNVAKYLKEPAIVGYVEKNSWAEKVGLKPGDKIVKINGYEINKWEELNDALLKVSLEGKKEVYLYIEREGKVLALEALLPQLKTGRENLGIAPYIPPVVGRVVKNSPAQQVGLMPGDEILEANGRKVGSWYELVEIVRENKGKPIKLKVKRGDQIFEVSVIPAENPETRQPFIGVSPKIETVKVSYPPFESFKLAVERTKELTILTYKAVVGIITGEISFRTLGGPIAIAQFAGEAAESGIIPFLSTMAFISLQLAIFNLFPLPILDGGLILLFLVEWIRGRPLPEKFKETWQKVGLALILTLMVFVFINDILRLFGIN